VPPVVPVAPQLGERAREVAEHAEPLGPQLLLRREPLVLFGDATPEDMGHQHTQERAQGGDQS
jgi:hypothetical protein